MNDSSKTGISNNFFMSQNNRVKIFKNPQSAEGSGRGNNLKEGLSGETVAF
jgi:hypothetical protein